MKSIFLYTTLIVFSLIAHSYNKSSAIIQSYQQSDIEVDKAKAFEVLRNKCNICHTKKNRRKIFTLNNMDQFAFQINEQVFIKKRMPKGREIVLTDSDFSHLKNWLNHLTVN
jgi:uncharacterized membrane protein